MSADDLSAAIRELNVLWEALHDESEQLAMERERYVEFFQHSREAHLVTDANGTIREANPAAAMLLGVRPAALLGKPLVSFVPIEERRFFRTNLNRINSGSDGPMLSWRATLRARAGEQRAAEFRVRALGSRAGHCWVLLPV